MTPDLPGSGAVRALIERRAWRHTVLPAISTDRRGGRRVLYVAPDDDRPSGGIRSIYRHVDLLRSLGHDAAVVHRDPRFRCSWFPHDTPVVAAGSVGAGPDDVLVIPELYGPTLDRAPAEVPTVVLNQGVYLTHQGVDYATTGPGAPYSALPHLKGILTVSEDSRDLLAWSFPGTAVHLVRNVVDAEVFHPGPPGPRRRVLTFTTSRRASQRNQLLHMLRTRGVLDGWELRPLVGLTEEQTAAALRESPVYLSFAQTEGFGMPAAEAMASGCYVVGFTGVGGDEYFDASFSSPVPEDHLLDLALAVERVLALYDESPDVLADAGARAGAAIRARYHRQGLCDDLASAYASLL